MDFVRCFTQSAAQTGAPLFFSGCFEFNGSWPERAAANRNYFEYLVKIARDTKIAYATPASVVDFYKTHYTKTPESMLYLVDIYAGITSNDKPPLYPDTMELENAAFKSIFLKGKRCLTSIMTTRPTGAILTGAMKALPGSPTGISCRTHKTASA